MTDDLIERLRKTEYRDGFAIILKQEVDEAADALAQYASKLECVTITRDCLKAELASLRAEVDQLGNDRLVLRDENVALRSEVEARTKTRNDAMTEAETLRAEVEANDRLWAHQCEEINRLRAENRENQMEWQRMLAMCLERIAALEAALKRIASGELDGDESYLLARTALIGSLAKPASD